MFGVKNDRIVVGLFAGVGLLVFFGVSFALETIGERVSGSVASRRETVSVNSGGGWRRKYHLNMDFSAKSVDLPAMKLNDKE
ncbi:MAG: hypothetical protein J2P21_22280 [Chloracidobacterium sp.]|nr:hypothetical protein [Chloracidobacterium sp.]